MKKIVTFLFILISFNSFSQFFPGFPPIGTNIGDSCNFENSCFRLTVDTLNPNNDWVIGTPNKPFFGQAQSLPNAIMTDSLSPYSSNNLSYFDLGFHVWNDGWMWGNFFIKFDHKYETDTLIDGGFITVSYDTGQTWINVIDDTCDFCSAFGGTWPYINSENLYTNSDTLMNGNFGFSGTSDWKTTTLQWIYGIAVKQMLMDTFMIRFNFISDNIQTNRDGWIIDNIIMGTVYTGSSIEELSNAIQVKLFPNITSDYFNYRIENSETLESIIITNIAGAVVNTVIRPQQIDKIDISHLPAGNYFVKFSSTTSSIVKRLVKN